jgi:hypothetical protein
MRCLWRCVVLHDGYTQLLPVSATNNPGHHHQHASAEAFDGETRLPRVQACSTSLPSALVSHLCDERLTWAWKGGKGMVAYLPLTNAPGKRDGPVEQLNIGVRYTQHP